MTVNFSQMSLRAKLLAAIVTTVVACFSATLWVMAHRSHDAVMEQGMGQAERTAELVSRQVEATLSDAMSVAETLKLSLEGVRGQWLLDRDSVNSMLKRVLEGRADLLGVYTGWEPDGFDGRDDGYRNHPGHDDSGRFIPYWNRSESGVLVEPLVGYEQAGDGDYYQVPKRTGKPYLAEPYEYTVAGRKMLITSLVQPVFHENRFMGIAGVDMALSDLAAELARIKPFGVGEVTLLSNTGVVVAHPDTSRIGRMADNLGAQVSAALARGERAIWTDAAGVLHLAMPVRVKGTEQNWASVVSVPAQVITGEADALRTTAVVMGVISVLLTGGVLFVLVTLLTRPLKHLADAMEALASGEGDLTHRLDEGAQDELGAVSRAVNRFLATLQRMFREVRDQSRDLGQGIGEVIQSTRQIADSSRSLAEGTSSNAATVEQITVSIGHIAGHADDANSVMQQTNALTRKSGAAVRGLEESMRDIASSMEGLASSLGGLSERSEQIKGIVKVIREIADQTNLLALNAAIEAARAGEQGRGFAVVADEVRKLAERTSSATAEIRGKIDAMNSETRGAVDSMHSTRHTVEQGVERASTVAAEIGQIEESIEQAASRVREIAEATKEQSAATTALAQASENASIAVQQTDDSIQQSSQTLDRLGNTSDRLGELVGRFGL